MEFQLFTPSGCLTEEALFRHTHGLLQTGEVRLADAHRRECELCSLALEGFAMSDQDSFSEDTNWLNQHFSGKDLITELPAPAKEPMPAGSDPKQRVDSAEVKSAPGKLFVSFFYRYRLGLAAAGLLLLITIGGRQVYIGLKHQRSMEKLAAMAVKPDSVKDMVIAESVTSTRDQAEKPGAPSPVVRKESGLIETVMDDLVVEDDLEITVPFDAAVSDMKSAYEPTKTPDRTTNKLAEKTVASGLAKKTGRISGKPEEEEIAEAEIFAVVEESPQYPGGDSARLKFLLENIQYPAVARESSIQGTVYISFVVERDGTITDVRVLRGIGSGCDEEAVRAIKLMPRWMPGKQRGKTVRVQFNMPIKFSLAG